MINVQTIKSEEDFEDMVIALLRKDNPKIQKIRGHGGDQGIDVYDGELPNNIKEIIQSKFFKHGKLNANRKRQVEDSFKKATQHKPKIWTLAISLNLTKGEQEWVLSLKKKYKIKLKIRFVQLLEIIARLLENESIAKHFLPGYKTKKEQKNFKEEIIEHIEIEPINIINFPKQIGCTQIRIFGKKLNEFWNELAELRYNKYNAGFDNPNVVKQNKEYIIDFIPDPKSNYITIKHNEDPFKVIFPYGKRIKLWIKEIQQPGQSKFLEITIFSSNHQEIKKVISKLKTNLTNKHIIKAMAFNTRMKTITNNFASSINGIKFDPNFTQKFKQNLKNKKVKVKNNAAFFSEEGGLPEIPEIADLLAGLKKIGPKIVSDLFYIHSLKTKRFNNKDLIGFDLHYSGRLRGFFNRLNFNDEDEMRMTLYNFIRKEAREVGINFLTF